MRLLLLFLIFCPLMACSAHSKEIKLAQKTKIEIRHDKLSKSPTIDVYLKGKGPFKFLLDTASTNSVISPELAQELGIEPDKSIPKSSVLLIDGIGYVYYSKMTDIYLGENKILRRSRMQISSDGIYGDKVGTIGLSTLFEAKIVNDPNNARLNIILNPNSAECDPLNTKSKCNFSYYDNPKIDVILGAEKFELLLDTGYEGSMPFILFKNNFTNRIWTKYNHVFKTERDKAISDLPYGRVFSKDFIFNGNKECFADFYIKQPKDKSPKMVENIGTIGWWVIKNVAFEFDVKTRKLSYPQGACPYKKINTNGIGAISPIEDGDRAYIHKFIVGSPVDLSGLVNFDILERVHLADGTIIEMLTEDLVMNHLDDILFSPAGTVVKFDVVRDEKIVTIPVVSKGPKFLNLDDIE